jgi:hypothetical protein
MSFRPVRKIAGIGNVFLGTELVDIAEYDLEIYEENPEDHEHHGANWTPLQHAVITVFSAGRRGGDRLYC